MACKDLPDHTRKVIIEYTGGFIGLEELAARLGVSSMTIYRWETGRTYPRTACIERAMKDLVLLR